MPPTAFPVAPAFAPPKIASANTPSLDQMLQTDLLVLLDQWRDKNPESFPNFEHFRDMGERNAASHQGRLMKFGDTQEKVTEAIARKNRLERDLKKMNRLVDGWDAQINTEIKAYSAEGDRLKAQMNQPRDRTEDLISFMRANLSKTFIPVDMGPYMGRSLDTAWAESNRTFNAVREIEFADRTDDEILAVVKKNYEGFARRYPLRDNLAGLYAGGRLDHNDRFVPENNEPMLPPQTVEQLFAELVNVFGVTPFVNAYKAAMKANDAGQKRISLADKPALLVTARAEHLDANRYLEAALRAEEAKGITMKRPKAYDPKVMLWLAEPDFG